jgi:hypothetical protein
VHGVDEACRLLAEDMLLEVAVFIGDVELLGRPMTRRCDGEHGSDGDGLDDRCECLVEVHAGALGEAVQYPSGFIAL